MLAGFELFSTSQAFIPFKIASHQLGSNLLNLQNDQHSCPFSFKDNGAVKSPLFFQERTQPNSTPRKCLQRFRKKQCTLLLAVVLAFSLSSWLTPPAPANAATATTKTPLEVAVEKYSVSFWTPETDTFPRPKQTNPLSTPRKDIAKRRQAIKKLQQKKAIAYKRNLEAVKQSRNQKQYSRGALKPDRGGYYDDSSCYQGHDSNLSVQHLQKSGAVAAVTACVLLTFKLSFVATLVVAAVAVGNEEFAAALRDRMAVPLEEWSYYSSTRGAHYWKDRTSHAKDLTLQTIATCLRNSKTTMAWASQLVIQSRDRFVVVVQKCLEDIKRKRVEKDEFFDAHNNKVKYETAQAMDDLMPREEKAVRYYKQTVASSSTTTTIRQNMIDERLETFYNRVREEEKGKKMSTVMLRKSSDEEFYQTLANQEANRRQKKQQVLNYGLYRTHYSTNAYTSIPLKWSLTNDRIEKVLKEPLSHKSKITESERDCSNDSSSHESSTEVVGYRPLGKPPKKERDQFDIRYKMWKYLSRKTGEFKAQAPRP